MTGFYQNKKFSNYILVHQTIPTYGLQANETTSSITVQPTATTTYTVDVTSGSTTCTSDPTTITVQPLPTVDLDLMWLVTELLKH